LSLIDFLLSIKQRDDKGGERKVGRFKQFMGLTFFVLMLIFSVALAQGQEKEELSGNKESTPQSLVEKAKQKAKKEMKAVKKDIKEAGKELKKSATEFPDKAGEEFEKTRGALKKTGKELKERFKEAFEDLKKLFKKK